jgi:cell division cycle 20-like protein 1 (cofactor of APC complex)
VPIKVLDAPALQDDYYLNLIDWSSQNFLAVGLSSSVYLWNAANSKVNKLCDLGAADSTTAVGWSLKGPHFSLGTNNGDVQIWDIAKMKKVRTLGGHSNRVGAIAWSSSLLSTGSRDKTILQRDLRESAPFVNRLLGHRQEVCGLKWSPDEQQLCSGGNDNKLLVWNTHSAEPILKYCDHLAAVKAVAWSPHQHGLLVSGGGTADRTIRFRNTLSGSTVKTVDVGSQVCNLMFSKSLN